MYTPRVVKWKQNMGMHLNSSIVTPGKIIFLNGTSSSGKTSIARELLQILDAPYVHMSFDTFFAMRTPRDIGKELRALSFARIISGFHNAIAAMISVGNDVIVDHVLAEQTWLRECTAVLAPFDVVFVGVHCSLEELERREHARGDRLLGLAKFQFERVHQHGIYDVECDTMESSAVECALKIKHVVQNGSVPTAFGRIRNLYNGIAAPTFPLEQLLAGITDQNTHGEIDTGPTTGNEIW